MIRVGDFPHLVPCVWAKRCENTILGASMFDKTWWSECPPSEQNKVLSLQYKYSTTFCMLMPHRMQLVPFLSRVYKWFRMCKLKMFPLAASMFFWWTVFWQLIVFSIFVGPGSVPLRPLRDPPLLKSVCFLCLDCFALSHTPRSPRLSNCFEKVMRR